MQNKISEFLFKKVENLKNNSDTYFKTEKNIINL